MSANTTGDFHALVVGASGLAGWAVVDQLMRHYPEEGVFSKVTALTNRPLDVAKSFWPQPVLGRPELQLASGVNLLEGSAEDVAELLRTKVKNTESITHVFHFANKVMADPLEDVKVSVGMLERIVGAVALLSPNLMFVAFPGGQMGYGIYQPGGTYKSPYHEALPRVPPPLGDGIPYYAMRDKLDEMMAGKKWTWCEVCPDAIIGFAPNGSALSLAGHWATWLSTYRLVNGRGARVHFPGTMKAYNALFNDASSSLIARQTIWASLHPLKSSRQLFNVADSASPSSWRDRWPRVAAYFGLEGVGPADEPEKELKPGEYVMKYKSVLEEMGFGGSQIFVPEWLDGYGFALDFDRALSLNKIREAGFMEEGEESWTKAFDMFREAGMIPRLD
ncbi:uncharacterized protein STEHIDRAFT_51972 [Stereum hirsutum FP-91666 SS1]|uniref:uncharacterized protein n=1 Tax=Stereum hirsutum (strain FP-91666) TaxID=721885 RepID=UPI000440EEE1|nr:uncharacterized protein STEHIDRAFT_51972 [Stereum hirsutum FP-91666 SS1]EIM89701.1 hypothetical protein STEHIDRAFT_51972 [Stereum hirsutum FP-91666 SS1]